MNSKIAFLLLFVLFFSAMVTVMISTSLYESNVLGEKCSGYKAESRWTALKLVGDAVGGGFPCMGDRGGNHVV